MIEATASPLFGITLTLAAYAASLKIYKKFKMSLLHPVITASAMIITFLIVFDIDVEMYQNGGSFISFMLVPATVALAVPLYRQISVLKTHTIIILVSISVGAVVSMVSTILISRAFGLPGDIVLSLAPKSVTTPIAVEASARIGGLPSITAMSVILTGITGAMIGPWLLKVLKISDPAAKGLAMGTAAHAIGTARTLEMGETEAAMSSLSIGIAGIITVLIAPLIISIL